MASYLFVQVIDMFHISKSSAKNLYKNTMRVYLESVYKIWKCVENCSQSQTASFNIVAMRQCYSTHNIAWTGKINDLALITSQQLCHCKLWYSSLTLKWFSHNNLEILTNESNWRLNNKLFHYDGVGELGQQHFSKYTRIWIILS